MEFTVFKFGFCFPERKETWKKLNRSVLPLVFGDRHVQQIDEARGENVKGKK